MAPRNLPRRTQVPVVPPVTDRRGRVDWDQVPSGAAVSMKINDPTHKLHSKRFLVRGTRERQQLVAPFEGGKDRPLPPVAPPDPARAQGSRVNPDDLRQALDTAYGIAAECPTWEWQQDAATYAEECGYDIDHAMAFGNAVAEVLTDAFVRRQADLRSDQRTRATTALVDNHNAQLRGKDADAADKLDRAQPWYGYGSGIHMADGPVTEDTLTRARAATQRESGLPLSFTLTRGQVKALLSVPSAQMQFRVQVLLRQQEQTVRDQAPHAAALPQAAGALVLSLPALNPAPFTDPSRAEAALALHASHDALKGHKAEPAPHLPVTPTGDPVLDALYSPAVANTTLAATAAAGDPVWCDQQALTEQLPHLRGAVATSSGVARAAAQALSATIQAPELRQLADVLPPEAMALTVVGLAYRSKRLQAVKDLQPVAEALLRQPERPLQADAEAGTGEGAAQTAAQLLSEAQVAADALGFSQFARCLGWAVTELPAFCYRYRALPLMPVELAFPNAPAALAATRATLSRGGIPDEDLVEGHTGNHLTLTVPLGRLVQYAEYLFHAHRFLEQHRALAYNMDGAQARGDDGIFTVPLQHLTLAERNAVTWLESGSGGVVELGLDRDWQHILAVVLNRARTKSALIVVPDGQARSTYTALSALLEEGVGPVCLLDSKQAIGGAVVAPIVVIPESQVVPLWSVVSVLHPELVCVSDPAAYDADHGLIDVPLRAVMNLEALFRVAFVPQGIAAAPLRLYDFVSWCRRGVLENYDQVGKTLRYADVLPPRAVLTGWEEGIGSGTGAASASAVVRIGAPLAPFLFGGVVKQQPGVPYHEQRLGAPALAVLDRFKELTKTAKAPGVLTLAGKEEQQQEQASTLRPQLDQVIEDVLDGPASPRMRAVAKAVAATSDRVMMLGNHQQFPHLVAALSVAGIDFAPHGDGLALSWGMDGALVRWRAGSGRVLVIDADHSAGVSLAGAAALHVVGAPATAARLVRPDGTGAASYQFRVIGYPYDSPADAGRWETLTGAVSQPEPLAKSTKARTTNTARKYKGEAVTVPLSSDHSRALRRFDMQGQPVFDRENQPSLWPGFFAANPHWAPVEQMLRDPLAAAHIGNTKTGQQLLQQVPHAGDFSPLDVASGADDQPWSFDHYDGRSVHLPKQAFFDERRFPELLKHAAGGGDVRLRTGNTLAERTAPGVLDMNMAGSHVRNLQGVFADPDVVWSRHNDDGSSRRMYLKRFLIGPQSGKGGPLESPSRGKPFPEPRARYHYAIGNFKQGDDGNWALHGDLDYTQAAHAKDLGSLLRGHTATVKPLAVEHIATRRMLADDTPSRKSSLLRRSQSERWHHHCACGQTHYGAGCS